MGMVTKLGVPPPAPQVQGNRFYPRWITANGGTYLVHDHKTHSALTGEQYDECAQLIKAVEEKQPTAMKTAQLPVQRVAEPLLAHNHPGGAVEPKPEPAPKPEEEDPLGIDRG